MSVVAQFVAAIGSLSLENVFNPYIDRCAVHDRIGAPEMRARRWRDPPSGGERRHSFRLDRPRLGIPGRAAYGAGVDGRRARVFPCREMGGRDRALH